MPPAVQVLERLVTESDRVPEAWCLLALAHYGAGAFHDAALALQEGRALLPPLDTASRGGDGGVAGVCIDGGELRGMFVELQERIEEGLELDAGVASEED